MLNIRISYCIPEHEYKRLFREIFKMADWPHYNDPNDFGRIARLLIMMILTGRSAEDFKTLEIEDDFFYLNSKKLPYSPLIKKYLKYDLAVAIPYDDLYYVLDYFSSFVDGRLDQTSFSFGFMTLAGCSIADDRRIVSSMGRGDLIIDKTYAHYGQRTSLEEIREVFDLVYSEFKRRIK